MADEKSYTQQLDEIDEQMRNLELQRANIRQTIRDLRLRRAQVLPLAELEVRV